MFSVIIPLYNKELSISNTLHSVLNQSFTEFEVVIVNDGSTDDSLKKVKNFNDKRIRIVEQENGGVSSARNRGIREAKYEWIAFLDADDLWMDDHLKTLVEMHLKYPDHKAFCNSFVSSTSFDSLKQNDQIIYTIIDNYFREGLKSFFFWTSVVCIHKSIFDDVGGFSDNLTRGEDLEVWMKIGSKYSIIKSNKITAIYNLESENKLMHNKGVPLDKCLENYLSFNNKTGFELAYIKMLAKNKIKSLFFQQRIKDAFTLLLKYNFKLL